MKFTLNWLKEYTFLDMPVEALADKLTMLGLEVDSVDELYEHREHLLRRGNIRLSPGLNTMNGVTRPVIRKTMKR